MGAALDSDCGFQHWKEKSEDMDSLVVQWLRLHAHNAGHLGSNPGRGTRSHMPQLKTLHMATKILSAAVKTHHGQIIIINTILKGKKEYDLRKQNTQ